MQNLSLFFHKKNNTRNANIDFLRVVAQFAIVIHHLLYHGKLIDKYPQFKELQFIKILCFWHVSTFGMVSGLIGNRNHNFSQLLYLWILVIFYSFIFYKKFNKSNAFTLNLDIKSVIFPVIYKNYWYFTAYFGIFPFLPLLNTNVSLLSQIEMKKIIYFMIGIFIMWPSYYNDCFKQNFGYSPFSLLIFYIFGCYISKYFI